MSCEGNCRGNCDGNCTPKNTARGVGGFHDVVDALVREVERSSVDGRRLGRDWDLAGDPAALRIAELWAYVADGVGAYTELASAESYLRTASDWTDLRRIAALTGYRPHPGLAAGGWVTVEVDRGASPLVPAGTRVQAPATPGRDAQTFEVREDTALRADWGGLTATPVPQPAAANGRTLRFLRDPGFRPGDRVLLVAEEGVPPSPPVFTWYGYWFWWVQLIFYSQLAAPTNRPIAVAVVQERADDLGTAVITFDRDLTNLLPSLGTPYAAYRIIATAGSARKLSNVVRVPATGSPDAPSITGLYGSVKSIEDTKLVLDTALDDVSAKQLVAVVDWDAPSSGCDITTVQRHRVVEWPVAPGATARASKLELEPPAGQSLVPTLRNASTSGRAVTAYVVDQRVVARTYVIPESLPPATAGTRQQVRVFPAPAQDPERIAIRFGGSESDWQVFGCARAADQEDDGAQSGATSVPYGRLLDLTEPAPTIPMGRAKASGNLARVRHGRTETGTLGSGDAALAGQLMAVPKPPVAYDVTDDGALVSSLTVRVEGLSWQEIPSLYGAGATDSYVTELSADGGQVVRFGDGAQGNRLPTGRGNVTESHRVGGGTVGELSSGAIDTLLGSVRGVVGVRGAGPTVGGADQDDERRIRRLAPGRARVFGRAVSRADLADLALAFPGVSHAVAWRGTGPPACGCSGSGEHLAVLRLGPSGRPRSPVTTELATLSSYVDSRRDTSIPLCVAPATVGDLALTCSIAVDPRRQATDVLAAVTAALAAQDGPLDPAERTLGQPLDASDVVAVVHGVTGVLGVPTLSLTDPARPAALHADIGRVSAEVYRLLLLSTEPNVTEEQA